MNNFAKTITKEELLEYTEREQVFIMMMKYGGSFVSNLGHLYFHADPVNRVKLEIGFSNYVEDYKEFLKRELNK